MSKTDKQYQAADAAIERAVTDCLTKIEQVFRRPSEVHPQYVIERALLLLCEGMAKLADDPLLANIIGPETIRLSNALADYRDSRWADR